MNGVQLKSCPVTERGKGNVIIQGSEFIAGMYLYVLIADGNVIDTIYLFRIYNLDNKEFISEKMII